MREAALCFALFLAAFGLRVWGAQGSLPYVGHPDEPILVDAAARIVKSGDLNPHNFLYPSFYIYVEALVTKANVTWGTFRGYYSGAGSLPDESQLYALAPSVYVWIRVVSAAVGALAVALLYPVGKRLFKSRLAGLMGAVVLGVAPLHVEYSHFGLTDVPLTLIGVIVLWSAWRMSELQGEEATDKRRLVVRALVCGLFVGMAAATKYNGAALILVPAMAWCVQPWRERLKDKAARKGWIAWGVGALAAIGLGAAVGFAMCAPYVLLDWNTFYGDIKRQLIGQDPVSSLGEAGRAFGLYARILSNNTMLFYPAVLGAGLLVYRRMWRAFLLIVPFFLFYWLNVSQYAVARPRNLIVLWPLMALLAGYAVERIASGAAWVVKKWSERREGDRRDSGRLANGVRWGAGVIGVVALAYGALDASLFYDRYQATPDSRNIAWAWVQERMLEGDRFAVELHPWQTQDWPDVLAFDVENPAKPAPLTARPPGWYAQHGYRYVLLSSNYKDALRDPDVWAEYQGLKKVKEFASDDTGGRGPRIEILETTSDAGVGLGMQHRQDSLVQDFGMLIGYDLVPVTSTAVLADESVDLEDGRFTAGQAVGLNVYYRALRDGNAGDLDWHVWVHMVDGTGNTVAQVDVLPLTGQLRAYPEVLHEERAVKNWKKGEMLAGVYNFDLPAGLPAGKYRIETGMWVPPNGPGAEMRYPDGSGSGDRVVLGEIEVR